MGVGWGEEEGRTLMTGFKLSKGLTSLNHVVCQGRCGSAVSCGAGSGGQRLRVQLAPLSRLGDGTDDEGRDEHQGNGEGDQVERGNASKGGTD